MNKEEERYYSSQVKLKVEALQECDRLKAELAAAKALLKWVFEGSCNDCSCGELASTWCRLIEHHLQYEGGMRDIRCPYIAFEETK